MDGLFGSRRSNHRQKLHVDVHVHQIAVKTGCIMFMDNNRLPEFRCSSPVHYFHYLRVSLGFLEFGNTFLTFLHIVSFVLRVLDHVNAKMCFLKKKITTTHVTEVVPDLQVHTIVMLQIATHYCTK